MTTTQRPRRILWQNVLTVVSAAILIGAEVFGAAFAGSWAIATLLGLGTIGARLLEVPLAAHMMAARNAEVPRSITHTTEHPLLAALDDRTTVHAS